MGNSQWFRERTPVGKQKKRQFLVPVLLITGHQEKWVLRMLLLPSEDLIRGPRMPKSIPSKGAPILYLPLVCFLGPSDAFPGAGIHDHETVLT
ncbi:hypothetical protein TNCV_3326971 [Trichonephila clavipes]|nr:hypothetical protein TNCV_3326971 [Trichonephila clavipes]